jgi:LAO/AO transport system kinase
MVDVSDLVDDVRVGRRAAISRAITLVESSRADHRAEARELLGLLAEDAGGAIRVGISGVPGVGKSTFIEALGTRLSVSPDAFIRPSPSAGTLGGVARATSQAMTVLEAAGFDVILVETVGVGQSEITVAGMVDTFAFLTIARTGDQLQGIKKGILEISDVIAVNKADGDRAQEAEATSKELAGALRMVYAGTQPWVPPVLTCSALEGSGIDTVWDRVIRHREFMGSRGLREKRAQQQLDFTWALVRDELDQRLRTDPRVASMRDAIREAVLSGELPAAAAADRILEAYDS